jgi:hypothetical protein
MDHDSALADSYVGGQLSVQARSPPRTNVMMSAQEWESGRRRHDKTILLSEGLANLLVTGRHVMRELPIRASVRNQPETTRFVRGEQLLKNLTSRRCP